MDATQEYYIHKSRTSNQVDSFCLEHLDEKLLKPGRRCIAIDTEILRPRSIFVHVSSEELMVQHKSVSEKAISASALTPETITTERIG